MKFNAGLLVLLMSVVGAANAQVNALPPTRHILVYGHAEARAIPDRFRITVSLEAVDPKADVARKKVEQHLQAVLAGLKAASVPDREIVASSLKIEPQKRYDSDLKRQVFEGIQVSRDVKIRFADQASLEAFLAKLATSEEVQVSGVTTELSDQLKLDKQLRGKAIESSRQKAETIAKAYGVRLAGLYSVSDVAPEFAYGIQQGEWPELYEWERNGDASTLDTVTVVGTAAFDDENVSESFRAGYVNFEDSIYAVFLIAD